MDTIKMQHLPDGSYVTDPFITKDEWLNVIRALEKGGWLNQLNCLLRFFRMPSNKGTCKAVAKEYGTDAKSEKNHITNLGMFAQKALGNRFQVESSDSDHETYCAIPMLGKDLGKKGFEWAIRPELVDALREYLLDRLLQEYRGPILSEGLDSTRSLERYKWQHLSSLSGKPIEEIVRFLASKDCNFVDRRYAGATLSSLVESFPDSVFEVFGKLLQEKPLNVRLQEFSVAAKAITPAGKTSFGDERTAAAFLAFSDPQKYTPYTSTTYETYCKYLGIPSKYAGQKYEHFLELLQDLIPIEKEDEQLVAALHRETDQYFWSDLLNAQDILWQMRSFMKESSQKNWLQRIYDQAIATKNNAIEEWYPEYEENVIFFQEMFQEGKTADDVSDEDRDYFLWSEYNGVSSNKQGRYSYSEYEKIKDQWPDIYDTLKRSVLAGEIIKDDYKQLFTRLVPLQSRVKYAAYHRFWATLFPDYLTTLITDSYFYSLYKSIRERDDSLPEKKGDWLEDNLTLMSFFKEKVIFEKPWHRAIFGWYLYDKFFNNNGVNGNDMNKYIQILEANKNLIFNGAPGTGKTYLAKSIAAKMICNKPYSEELEKDPVFSSHCRFVQFHPSYDYTDFVEGLRPVKDSDEEIAFKRKDGVFKDFCKKAINDTMVNGVDNFDEAWDKLVEDLNEKGEVEVKLLSGSKSMFVELNVYGDGLANRTYEDSVAEDVDNRKWIKGRSKFFSKGQLYNIYRGLPGIPSGGHDHYRKAIVEEMKRSYGLKPYKAGMESNEGNGLPYVFIIDEINRGEISKIFGELFFSIDPGYRGTRGLVLTQYQNLVEPTDVFFGGFYVPKNVYIIGTMNDIDRSVESMDFAMRRRFAFEEIFADKNVPMLDGIQMKEILIDRMNNLNEIIAKEPELGVSYQVGGAYFAKVKDCQDNNQNIDWQVFWNRYLRGLLNEYTRGLQNKPKLMAAMEKAIVNPEPKKDEGSAE